MFIIAKRNFLIPREGQEPYKIKKDFVGEIPEGIASHWLIKAAMEDGTIAAPQNKKDAALEEADTLASRKEAESDIRPDAQGDNKSPTIVTDKIDSETAKKKTKAAK